MIDGPARVLHRKCGVILTADVGRHPAVRAWTAATSLATPGCVHVLRDKFPSGIYRLLGVGRGGTAVFAKRSLASRASFNICFSASASRWRWSSVMRHSSMTLVTMPGFVVQEPMVQTPP